MFLRLPFEFSASAQHVLLVLNTVLLIGLLITIEFAYAEASGDTRRSLRLFVPLLVIIAGILLYAVYSQSGSA
jgi:hypothetical protein